VNENIGEILDRACRKSMAQKSVVYVFEQENKFVISETKPETITSFYRIKNGQKTRFVGQ
jgi:hypothetical protein